MLEKNIKKDFCNKETISLRASAEELGKEYHNIKELIIAIRKFIISHADSLPEKHKPGSILESRFTPAEDAFKKGMISCGAIVNIGAEMLRHLGYEVKLIHGECKQSVDHAWLSVFEPKTNSWVEYDLTRKEADIPSTHTKKLEVNSWEEIEGQIRRDHETLQERRKEREV